MQLANQIEESDVEQAANFYKGNFSHVAVITCNQCQQPLAFELGGSLTGDLFGFKPNELGHIIVSVGHNLLSSRVRLDEHHPGQRMMGYQCATPIPNPEYPAAKKKHDLALAEYEKIYEESKVKAKEAGAEPPPYHPPQLTVQEKIPCGNDTRVAAVEEGLIPVGALPPDISPFEKHKIAQKINANPPYPPDFEETGNIRRYETFKVEGV